MSFIPKLAHKLGEKVTIICVECDGYGKVYGNDESNIIKTCEACNGTGKMKAEKAR